MRKWRLTVSLDHFKAIRKKFDDAGIKLQAYNYSFNDSFTDEEIERGFQMAQALGVKLITGVFYRDCGQTRCALCRQAQNHGGDARPFKHHQPQRIRQARKLCGGISRCRNISGSTWT
jgi:sugar phosphate isomerase/epimerase